MNKVLDIDKFLQENGVEVKLKGKTYVVRDIPLDVQDYLQEDNINLKLAASKILGCSEEDLDGYEAVALMKIVRFVQEKLLGEALGSPEPA